MSDLECSQGAVPGWRGVCLAKGGVVPNKGRRPVTRLVARPPTFRGSAASVLLGLLAISTVACLNPFQGSGHAAPAERIDRLKAKAEKLDRRDAAKPAKLTVDVRSKP